MYVEIKQVYEDRVILRSERCVFDHTNCQFVFLLSDKHTVFIKELTIVKCLKKAYRGEMECSLLEITQEDFDKTKMYDEATFENTHIPKNELLITYDDLVNLAKKQENENFLYDFEADLDDEYEEE